MWAPLHTSPLRALNREDTLERWRVMVVKTSTRSPVPVRMGEPAMQGVSVAGASCGSSSAQLMAQRTFGGTFYGTRLSSGGNTALP